MDSSIRSSHFQVRKFPALHTSVIQHGVSSGSQHPADDVSSMDRELLEEFDSSFPVNASGQGEMFQATTKFGSNVKKQLDFTSLCAPPAASARQDRSLDKLLDIVHAHDEIVSYPSTDGFSTHKMDRLSNFALQYPDSLSQDTSLPSHGEGFEPCTPRKKTCMPSALKSLESLHMPPSMCLSTSACTSTSSPRLIDSVLLTNRRSVQCVSEVLACTCSIEPRVQLILTIICTKLIAWYLSVLRMNRIDPDMLSLGEWSSMSMDDGINLDHSDRVINQPITVGKFSLDIELEIKVRAQVVLNELEQVEALIQSFLQRLTGAGLSWGLSVHDANFKFSRREESGHAEMSRKGLIGSLLKQLHAVKAEGKAMLEG